METEYQKKKMSMYKISNRLVDNPEEKINY